MDTTPDPRKFTIQPIKDRLNQVIDQQSLLTCQVHYPKNLKSVIGLPPSDQNEDRYIKNSAKLLQRQDILSSGSYSLYHKTAFQNTYFASGMKSKSTSLSSFQMDTWHKVNHPGSKTILKSLASLKNLRDLQTSFYCCQFPATNDLHLLFDRLLSARKLTHFTFSAFSCQGFDAIHLKALCSFLARSPQIQILSLNFDSTVDDGNQFLNTLIPALSKLTSLTRIHLLLMGTMPIQAENIIKLFMTLSTIKTLTDLTIFPNSYRTLCENTGIEPLAEGLQYLNASSIRRLHLQTYQNLTGKGFLKISQALKKFTSLQILHLNLSGSLDITDEGLTQLSSTLSGFLSLVSLSLLFSSFLQDLASALKSLHNLAHLKLSFDTADLTFEQFQELSSSLKMLKSSLKFLEISSHLRCSLSDSMIESLADALKELTLIKHLSLDFRYALNLTSKGIEALIQAIQGLLNLSCLTLILVRNQGVDKTAVITLSQALKSLPCLYSIELDLAQCEKINSEDLQSLFAVLHEMKKVCKFNLRLPLCPDLAQEVGKLKQRFNLRIYEFLDSLEIMTL